MEELNEKTRDRIREFSCETEEHTNECTICYDNDPNDPLVTCSRCKHGICRICMWKIDKCPWCRLQWPLITEENTNNIIFYILMGFIFSVFLFTYKKPLFLSLCYGYLSIFEPHRETRVTKQRALLILIVMTIFFF